MLDLNFYKTQITRIRKKLGTLKSYDSKLIYKLAENKINQILIKDYGIYFNSKNQFESVAKINVIHLRNILDKLNKGDCV